MNALLFVLGVPLLGGLVLALTGHRPRARDVNVAFSLGTFLARLLSDRACHHTGTEFVWDQQFYIDPLNVFLVTLTAFVGLTTSIFSRPYMRVEQDHGKMTPRRMRLYHSMYQLFSFTMLLGLTTNNLGIIWVAMEAATLTTVLLVSVYRTAASLEAAWKYFILCGVGIAQALFGTILLVHGGQKVLGAEHATLLWTSLDARQGPAGLHHHHAGICVFAGGLWHQDWPGAAAQLAAGRPCRGPNARFGCAVRPAAQCGHVRGAAHARC
jgi:hydrogenase-4 component F